MSTIAFIAVIASALFHSGYNLLIKVSVYDDHDFCLFHLRGHTKPSIRQRALHCYRKYPFRVLLGGVLLFFSNISYRFGLETTDVSYAAGARKSATLFAVLMSIFLLKEPYGFFRFLAGLMIAPGIVLIKIG